MYFIEKYDQDEKKDYETYQKLLNRHLEATKERAKDANEEAMFILAIHYGNKRNQDYNPEESYHYLQRLYASGSKEMQYFLAHQNYEGEGVEKNIYRAMEYFEGCRNDKENPFCGSAYLCLANIYFFEERFKDIPRGISYIKEYVNLAIELTLQNKTDLSADDYRDENEFRYNYDSLENSKDFAKTLKEHITAIENHQSVDIDCLEEEEQLDKDITKFFLAYCYLSGNGKPLDQEKGFDLFKKGFAHLLRSQKLELLKADFPAYIKNHPSGAENQELNPYGYVFDEEDLREYKKMSEEQARYHVPAAVMFLAYGYLGKFKYFNKDISKAIDYLKEGLSLKIPEAAFHLAEIYHDGLDDGIIDYQRSKDYLNKAVSLGFNQANLLLAKYALLDDKDIQACTTHLLNYAKKEQESDKIMFEATTQNNFQDAKNQAPELDEYFSSLKSGYEHSTMGIDAYEEKDYDKAVSYLEKGAKEYGMTQAAIMMAICYLNGHGITKDEKIALEIIDELIYTEIF